MWGLRWRGSAAGGPHTGGTEGGSNGRSLQEGKAGHMAGETHKGEIMKALHAKRMQTYGKTGSSEGSKRRQEDSSVTTPARDAGGLCREGKKGQTGETLGGRIIRTR